MTSKRRRLKNPERLEDRLVMDGAGFVHTDPPEDPDSIVGVAEIVANDDYRDVSRGTHSLRISPLGNDELPEGSAELTIKLASKTRAGATVTVSEDGKHLLYTAGEGGFEAWDSFYYIVQTEDGKLGKANVTLGSKVTGGGFYRPPIITNVSFTVLEDSGETRLDVLRNDYQPNPAEITAVSTTSLGGNIRIAEDGSELFYMPKPGVSGRDYFTYTIRLPDGAEATYGVTININKPYQIVDHPGDTDDAQLNFGVGPLTLQPLANDQLLRPTPLAPVIVDFVAPNYAGTVTLAEDGRSFLYEPTEDFKGQFNISYTVRYGSAEHQVTSGEFAVSIRTHFWATPDWFAVDPLANSSTKLEVLANEVLVNPYRSRYYRNNANYLPPATQEVSLQIVGVSEGSVVGTLTVAEDGQSLNYTPAEGFLGDETFTYTVEDSTGARQTTEVTLHVAEPGVDPSGVDRFATEGELQQYLIDRAAQQLSWQFGQYVTKYQPAATTAEFLSQVVIEDRLLNADSTLAASFANNHSETNTQVAGVDEADIVETDGRYVYTFTDGQLAIVDLNDPENPALASLTLFEGRYDKMYLQGDRLTLIRSGSLNNYRGWSYQANANHAEVVVLELGDRTAPSVVERTEIDGYIADSRAIGDRVHLVVKRHFDFPALGGDWIIEPEPPADTKQSAGVTTVGSDVLISDISYYPVGNAGIWRNESLTEYVDRVRSELLETGLPTFKTYDAAGELIASGLLTQPADLHKAIAGEDLVVSLLTLDAGDDSPGPVADATSFVADDQTTVYASASSAYLFSYDRATDATTIHKLDLEDDGTSPLVASGTIRGRLLNQFSADEFDGTLRVATTQQERELDRNDRWRQQRLFNNLLVLEQQGNQLNVVGEITNLAPTETIHSVRYQGDRAFVVTFRLVDPLFAIDLSNPTTPTVEGALKIPGFSNYLHPVGEDYLIGIGRDADEITGRLGPLQITLFNVADLSNPTVADQVTFEGARWVNSEAWVDHLAVAFFAKQASVEGGTLAMPISWSEQVTLVEPDQYGRTTRYENRSAMFTFDVDVDAEGATIEATGQIEHSESTNASRYWNRQNTNAARRAVRIGESIITVSNHWVQVHDLNHPAQQLGELPIGPPLRSDQFSIEEDSGTTTLDVLANDLPTVTGEVASIVSITQPTVGGTAELADDGRSIQFTPADDFFGQASFTYAINDPLRGEITTTVEVAVQNTPDDPEAIDDSFSVAINAVASVSEPTVLNVLANDLNPDYQSRFWLVDYDGGDSIAVSTFASDSHHLSISYDCAFFCWWPGQSNGLTLVELGETDNGGVVEINDRGQLVYLPAEGFEGVEIFTYTIRNHAGIFDTATVMVNVTDDPPMALAGFQIAAAGNVINPVGPPAALNTTLRTTQLSAANQASEQLLLFEALNQLESNKSLEISDATEQVWNSEDWDGEAYFAEDITPTSAVLENAFEEFSLPF